MSEGVCVRHSWYPSPSASFSAHSTEASNHCFFVHSDTETYFLIDVFGSSVYNIPRWDIIIMRHTGLSTNRSASIFDLNKSCEYITNYVCLSSDWRLQINAERTELKCSSILWRWISFAEYHHEVRRRHLLAGEFESTSKITLGRTFFHSPQMQNWVYIWENQYLSK